MCQFGVSEIDVSRLQASKSAYINSGGAAAGAEQKDWLRLGKPHHFPPPIQGLQAVHHDGMGFFFSIPMGTQERRNQDYQMDDVA